MEFFENVGAANFEVAAGHPMARLNALTPIYEELGERFRDIRLALNDTAERLLHLDESSDLLFP